MQLQSILRRVYPHAGFVYGKVRERGAGDARSLVVEVRPRKGARAFCSGCGKRRALYDTLPERLFTFVPLWAMRVSFEYAMRRVSCRSCGVKVEWVPWADGKSHVTHAFAWFIASWAKALSWTECARRFRTSWDTVFTCVAMAVRWGLEHRDMENIGAIGVDELAWKKGHKYLTLVYQLDRGRSRLLHIAKNRTAASFHAFFDLLGEARTAAISFVASDMWAAFLSVIKARCPNAAHILDRFHVTQMLTKAVDTVRRDEVRGLRAKGKEPVLTKTRWLLLRNRDNLKRKDKGRLRELLEANLRTVRAYLLKEEFRDFWNYISSTWAEKFLDRWTTTALRSRLEPFKRFARTLRKHRDELLNWFAARRRFAAGATEGFNNKARITTRKAYGFRTYEHARIALYHALGDLPQPPWLTHRFA